MTDPMASPGGDALQAFELSPQEARAFRQRSALQRSAPPAVLGLTLAPGVDLARLERSLLQVVARHEVLRTSYRQLPLATLPAQVIHPQARVTWRHPSRSAAAAANTVEPGAPALEVQVEDIGQGTRRLSLRLFGAALDTLSVARLASEWAAVYVGRGPSAPPVQYADFAAWRSEISAEPGPARDYWLRRIQTRIPGGPLPFRGRSVQSAWLEPRRERLELPPELAGRWHAAAHNLAQPPALLALAAWVTLLCQHGDTDSFTLAYDGQERGTSWDDVLGLCSEPLPLRVHGLAESDGGALVAALSVARGELLDWRDRFPSSLDVEPYVLGFRHVPLEPAGVLADAGLRIESVEGASAPHRLALELLESASGPELALCYDPALYDGNAAALIGDQYTALLAELCARPHAKLRELSAASSSERRRVLEVLGRPDPLPSSAEQRYRHIAAQPSLEAQFAAVARDRSSAVAVRAGERQLTYAELEERASRVAGGLAARGVQLGSRVAHFLPRDLDAIVALRAIVKLGAVYVPIDPDYPKQRAAFLLSDCGAELVLTTAELVTRLPEAWREPSRWLAMESAVEQRPLERWPNITPEHLAYVIYTSGSTGQPRGVPITHGGALHSLAARLAYYPDPTEHFLLLSSFAFDSSIAGLFGTLAQGGCLHLSSDLEQKDADRIARLVAERGVTQLLALPSLYQLILHTLPDLRHSLRAAIVAGESCPASLVQLHHAKLPSVRLYNEYGATEAAVWSTVGELRAETTERPVSIGRPIPGTRTYVLDEKLEPRAPGLTGEIYVAAPGLSPGYLNRPELTREKFIEHRGERLYRTGDYGYWDDRGELVFVGRADGQIKIRGYRIELGEIEAALRRVAGTDAVVVLADRGEDQQLFLRAFIESERELDAAALRRELARVLPDPMLPREFQTLRAFPLGPNGKLDRRALLALEPRRERAPFVAPETTTEQGLAALWHELLGAERVGRADDFFMLGGHSLLAIRLVHELQSRFGADVPVLRVFEHPTLAALAGQVDLATAGARADSGVSPPTRAQAVTPLGAAATSGAPALFCIDPTGQHSSAYAPIALALGGDVQVLGVELGGALLEHGPHIERLARSMSEAIRGVQPAGGYHLLGWSLGGVLAVAVTCELERQGHPVASLAILDTQPLTRLYQQGEPDPVAELAEYLDPDRKSELLGLPSAELDALRARLGANRGEARVHDAVTWAVERGFLASSGSIAAYLPRYALLRDAARFIGELPNKGLRAPLSVFWARDTLSRYGGPPMDWQAHATEPVQSTVVAGDHAAVLRAPELHAALRLELTARKGANS